MRKYFATPLNTTFGFLAPNSWPQHQFDTLPAAQACQELHPSWLIIDLWSTLRSFYLIEVG